MTAGERGKGDGQLQLRAAVHDLQTRLGSVHIAITAVAELDFEPKTQTVMLETASEETMRAAAEVAGIASLAGCLLDDSAPAPCDLAAEFNEVAEFCRLTGLDAVVQSDRPVVVSTPPGPLRSTLESLMRIVSGPGRTVTGRVEVVDNRARVSLAGDGGNAGDLPQLAGFLVSALGARQEPAPIGLCFSLALGT